MARIFEKLDNVQPTFQAVKVTPTGQPPAEAVDTVIPFITQTVATDQTGTYQAPVPQKQVPSTAAALLPHGQDRQDSASNSDTDMDTDRRKQRKTLHILRKRVFLDHLIRKGRYHPYKKPSESFRPTDQHGRTLVMDVERSVQVFQLNLLTSQGSVIL